MGISDWEDMMADTLTHYEYVSNDSYGKPTYGSPATLTCRLIFSPTNVISSTGEEVVSKATAWVSSTSLTIDPNDKFESSFGEELYVVTANRIPDEDGVHHFKIFFN